MIDFKNLLEVYHELGTFEAKAIMEENLLKNFREHEFRAIDSSGKEMKTTSRVWGNKLKCCFTIDNSVADGVALARLSVTTADRQTHVKTAYFWVVKP